MTWRDDIQMPERVARLPRTAAGIPITYTVAWTSERRVEVRPDPILRRLGHVDTPAIFATGNPGDGTPKLTMTETSRQRRSAVLGLCQVCAHPIPEPTARKPRWLADLRIKGQVIRLDRIVPLIVDSWTCPPCMGYALKVCPGLIRKTYDRLELLRVRSYTLVATIERPESISETELPYGAIGYVKIAPTDYDVLDWHEAAAELEPRRVRAA